MKTFRNLGRLVPLILISILMALVVWVAAVTAADPNETVNYPNPIPIKVIGLDPSLVVASQSVDSVLVSINAPHSIQAKLASSPELIQATINLSGKASGELQINPKIELRVRPAKVVRISPAELDMELEKLSSTEMPVVLKESGTLPVGYSTGEAKLAIDKVKISGPESQIDKVAQVVALVDINNVTTSISRNIALHALDSRGAEVSAVNLEPKQIGVELPIKQLAGYRNVVIKINTVGQIAPDFYLTGIVANPPNLTVYATDPDLAKDMPAYIETAPIDLNGAELSFSTTATLNLPAGIELIDAKTVTVQVGLAPIESSRQMMNIPVRIENLGEGLTAVLNPKQLNAYVSGPIYILNKLTEKDISATIDLNGKTTGTYQLNPQVQLPNDKIQIDSTLPSTVEVVISKQ